MRSTLIARLLLAAVALAVAASLIDLERDRDSCQSALDGAYLASLAATPDVDKRVDAAIADCPGAEPLSRVAVGLRTERPRAATRLARAAVRREPDSYVAWRVLAIAAPSAEAAVAARWANELNPISAEIAP